MAPTTRPPRRRLDPEQRQATILEVAARLFAAHPYAEVSLARVASEAGASEALVHKYFATKPELYADVLRGVLEALWRRILQADAALPGRPGARERVRTALLVYLDHVAEHPSGWASPFLAANDPEPARAVRRRARAVVGEALERLLPPDPTARRRYAVAAFPGFLEVAALTWAEAGCPADLRHPIIDTCLGALEGALGDWGG